MAKVTGTDALRSALAAFGAELIVAMPGIVHTAGQTIEAEIRSRAPVDKGTVVHDLETVTVPTAHGATSIVQIADSAPEGKAHHAIFAEYGTSKMAAEPFFRPGVQASRVAAESIIAAGVSELIANYVR